MSLYELLQVIPNNAKVRIANDGENGSSTVFCGTAAEIPFCILRDQEVIWMCGELDDGGYPRLYIFVMPEEQERG